MTLRRLAAPYFALQGALTLLWWAALFLRPPLRAYFQPPGGPEIHLLAFLPPDLLLFAGASLAAAYAFARDAGWRSSAAWLVAGATTYAALYGLALALATGAAWLSAVLMLPAALCSLLFATTANDDRHADVSAGRAR